jgi:tellurite resistance protein
MSAADQTLLVKVIKKLGDAPSYAEKGVTGSILKLAASSYGFVPSEDEVTVPTGFDPQAAALFEALIESAYLVANADGDFDTAERAAFEHVVLSACGGAVAERQVHALLEDLRDQLAEDGIEKRVKMVARTITKAEHAREVVRIAVLLAHVSGGVSAEERQLIELLAKEFGLERTMVDGALAEVERALND